MLTAHTSMSLHRQASCVQYTDESMKKQKKERNKAYTIQRNEKSANKSALPFQKRYQNLRSLKMHALVCGGGGREKGDISAIICLIQLHCSDCVRLFLIVWWVTHTYASTREIHEVLILMCHRR